MTIEKKKQLLYQILFWLAFILSTCVIVYSLFCGKTFNDYYWHYRVGEWIVNNKVIPKEGIFSWYALENNLYWFSHEWLSEVLLYVMSFGSGKTMLIWVSVLQFVFLAITSFSLKKHLHRNAILFVVYTILSTLILSFFFRPRPQIYSFFLFYSELLILYRVKRENEDTALVYLLPVIGVLWANLHGGSSNLIYILPVFFILTSLFDFSFGKLEFKKLKKRTNIKLGIITVVSTLGLCLNPHGFRILTYPFVNMGDKVMLSNIQEWASPDMKELIGVVCAVPIVIVALLLITSVKKVNMTDLLLFLFFSFLFFRSVRFIALFTISSFFYLYEYAIEIDLTKILFFQKQFKVAIYLSVTLLFVMTVAATVESVAEVGEINVSDGLLSDEAVGAIKRYNPKRPYNSYNLGGELIYNGIDVFIDGRADLYSGNILEEYFNMINVELDENGEWNAREMIEKYNFDMFICPIDGHMGLYLSMNPDDYECIFKDDKIKVFIPLNK